MNNPCWSDLNVLFLPVPCKLFHLCSHSGSWNDLGEGEAFVGQGRLTFRVKRKGYSGKTVSDELLLRPEAYNLQGEGPRQTIITWDSYALSFLNNSVDVMNIWEEL